MNEPEHKNKYEHACSHCYFLGSCVYKGDVYDLYLHYNLAVEKEGRDNYVALIADRSNYGGDYISGTIFGLMALLNGELDSPLAVAIKKLKNRGWIHHDSLRIYIPEEDFEYIKYFMQPHIKKEGDQE